MKASALDGKNVSVTSDYKLALASDVPEPLYYGTYWKVSEGTAEYHSAYSTANGYRLSEDKKTVIYDDGTKNTVLAKITGLKSTATEDDFSVKENVITLKASALGGKKVSVTGDYKLALAKNVKKIAKTAAGFTVDGTTATYKTKKVSAGYTLSDDKKSVSYSKASGGKTLFTISGLKKNTKASNLSLNNKTVTLKADALDKRNVTISDGYNLKLTDSVKKLKQQRTQALQSTGQPQLTNPKKSVQVILCLMIKNLYPTPKKVAEIL